MWILQNVLIVVGSVAVGTLLGVITVWVMIYSFLITSRTDPTGTTMSLWFGGLFFGVPLGAIAGLIGSIYGVRSQCRRDTWSRVVWVGILFGLLMSVTSLTQSIQVFKNLSHGYGWLGNTCFKIACGTVGGILAAAGQAIYRLKKKAR